MGLNDSFRKFESARRSKAVEVNQCDFQVIESNSGGNEVRRLAGWSLPPGHQRATTQAPDI
jgi:hypothetical protein